MGKTYWVGVDVGSTTVKAAVLDPGTRELLFWDYQRHNADQAGMVARLLSSIHEKFPDSDLRVAFCGSAGEPFSRVTGSFFVQEVVANAIAIKEMYPTVRVAIELGGQDAKVIFFRQDEKTGQLVASDMRMNGSCAGGTGAFVDQIAELLDIKTEEFNALAEKGNNVYDISGRCGVFAKTDIQPLLNQGVARADIALSSLHAIAKQTIGGLAQGMDVHPPVIFEGGPLTFNPVLVRVFKERLNLEPHQVIVPERPEVIVAIGAALSNLAMFEGRDNTYKGLKGLEDLKHFQSQSVLMANSGSQNFFDSPEDRKAFHERHPVDRWQSAPLVKGTTVRAYLGIDGGSTTTKFVLLGEDGVVLDKFYKGNQGDPLALLKGALLEVREKYTQAGVTLEILGCGTTGYAENLFAQALKADFHTVETVAHAEAAKTIDPQVSFILDIGGQDMKAIFVKNGIVTGIVLNEACSAGCGSFLETYAKSLKIPVHEIAELSFRGDSPSKLGSRCTVFMNSSIITEQKMGKTTGEIMAGLCRSVIENVFTKVIRLSNLEALGPKIIVQGGTFKNDAVLRAFEQYSSKTVIRPDLPGEMGALGIALLTKKFMEERRSQNQSLTSRFIGLENLDQFTYRNEPGNICHFCANNCNRTVVYFSDGSHFITGNRCEKGEILGDLKDPSVKAALKDTSAKMEAVPDLMRLHREVMLRDFPVQHLNHTTSLIIGIPRSLDFWASMPYWRGVFRSLGIKVKVSRRSSYEIFEKGLPNVPSDTACFPAKLSHGHVKDLVEQGVDRIFMPMMIQMPVENKNTKATWMCPVIQGYPAVIDKSDEPTARYGVPFDHPIFHWYDDSHKEKQVARYLNEVLGIPMGLAHAACKEGAKAALAAANEMEEAGKKVLEDLKSSEGFAVVLSGRPYHSDELVNHGLSSHFTRLGIPVLTIDSLPALHDQDLGKSRMEMYNAFHTRMIGAAFHAAHNPNLELVQIVSFGCGHDAIISDEMARILREKSGKELLVLKLDEGENKGPLSIRVKSFVETIRSKRKAPDTHGFKLLNDPYPVKFTGKDRARRTLLVPNLSPAFSNLISKVIGKEGMKTYQMKLADERAVELGKKFVHNDICYPAQINIGEILRTLESGEVDPKDAAAGLAQNCQDCRAGHYVMLARKALDEAGYEDVPIFTTGEDTKGIHPGFKLSPFFQIRMIWGLATIDAMEAMVRAIRPYELEKGMADKIYETMLPKVTDAVQISIRATKKVMEEAVALFNSIPADRTVRKPRVGILGEVLLNFHPTANGQVERYLESHGMEIVEPTLSDFFRKDFLNTLLKSKRDLLPNKFFSTLVAGVAETAFKAVGTSIHNILKGFKFNREHFDITDLAQNIQGLIDDTYLSGEGWLMAGEILQLAKEGVNSFLILNPFGCMPNHITGRGMIKPLKKRLPHINILSLDFDPDTSFANIENRLQMLVITGKELEKRNLVPEAVIEE